MHTEEVTIRIAKPEDAEHLLEIYKPYVLNTSITFEYEVPSVEEFRDRIKNILKKYPYIVAVKDSRIVGYACARAFVGRAAYDWSAETSIYVDVDNRYCGIGGKLYAAMENILKEMNILNINACIGYPEIEDEYLTKNSVKFHEHLGFSWVGEFHKCGYKFGRWYGIVWMEKMIGEHVDNPKTVKTFDDVKDTLNDKFGIH